MTIDEQAHKNALDVINRVFGQMFSSPSYRYFENENKDRYFYTCKKINHKGSPRYVAGIYRYIKTKKQWKIVKRVGFAKKKTAIARAREWSKENR